MNISIDNVKLSKKSKDALKKWEASGKVHSYNDVAGHIEAGHWNGPVQSYDFADIKEAFEASWHTFFNVPKDVLIEMDSCSTTIMSFDKGVYPKFS